MPLKIIHDFIDDATILLYVLQRENYEKAITFKIFIFILLSYKPTYGLWNKTQKLWKVIVKNGRLVSLKN